MALFSVSADQYRYVKNTSFLAGETYTYKIKYGFLTIGQANVDVHKKIFNVQGRPCYRVNVTGRTAGLASLWKVKNMYRSYIDTTAMIPHKFEYSAREGNFERDQSFTFDQHRNVVIKKEKNKVEEYNVPDYVQDVVSGYYYLRTIDFADKSVGSMTSAPMFFDDKLYHMKVKYVGKEKVKTKFGTIETVKLYPILPHNDLFEGDEGIRIFVSNDSNHVPIRLEIDFSFGTISMELHNYRGERYPFHWI
ncbi:DUF3108 domain-containing protein [Marinilongibacter aquaticus]|uniref:DUF3108 domain-containing protein n=1 Tax=Marinilongibacter aquaticus TaxID=2975157 RepID=UPI0021BD8BAD|nr:DUF3108 domain-containing protein [Marinilongibacter aquaticus]UBM58942.1 DUF3108 domain-containing protein [Marinilongibacter aquaticus]